MAGPSHKKPEKIFNCQLTLSIKLKQSIESLSDREFNPERLARVDISDRGFQITYLNPATNVSGYLFLKSSGFISFHCSNPIVNKVISLTQTSQVFVNSTDDDTVTVFHRDGSYNLTFILGSAPKKQQKVMFLRKKFKIEKFPELQLRCDAVMMSESLRQMIERLEQIGNYHRVKVAIPDNERSMTIYIGENDPWIYNYYDGNAITVSIGGKDPQNYKYDGDRVFGVSGREAVQNHHARFIMRPLEALKKASMLGQWLHLSCLTTPVGYAVMRFDLGEVGDLVFISKTENVTIISTD